MVEISRPDGPLLARDATILDPADRLAATGRLGEHAATGTAYVISAGFEADILREAAALAAIPGTVAGASSLPAGLGAWLKVLGPDGPAVSALLGEVTAAAHHRILGSPSPPSRRP